jgi:hypothetical protein
LGDEPAAHDQHDERSDRVQQVVERRQEEFDEVVHDARMVALVGQRAELSFLLARRRRIVWPCDQLADPP